MGSGGEDVPVDGCAARKASAEVTLGMKAAAMAADTRRMTGKSGKRRWLSRRRASALSHLSSEELEKEL